MQIAIAPFCYALQRRYRDVSPRSVTTCYDRRRCCVCRGPAARWLAASKWMSHRSRRAPARIRRRSSPVSQNSAMARLLVKPAAFVNAPNGYSHERQKRSQHIYFATVCAVPVRSCPALNVDGRTRDSQTVGGHHVGGHAMMKSANALLLTLLFVPTLAAAAEDSSRARPQHGTVARVHARRCPDCHDATYRRTYLCDRARRCIELYDEHEITIRRDARRHSLTTTRRIKCA